MSKCVLCSICGENFITSSAASLDHRTDRRRIVVSSNRSRRLDDHRHICPGHRIDLCRHLWGLGCCLFLLGLVRRHTHHHLRNHFVDHRILRTHLFHPDH